SPARQRHEKMPTPFTTLTYNQNDARPYAGEQVRQEYGPRREPLIGPRSEAGRKGGLCQSWQVFNPQYTPAIYTSRKRRIEFMIRLNHNFTNGFGPGKVEAATHTSLSIQRKSIGRGKEPLVGMTLEREM